MSDMNEFDRWLLLFNGHGDHNLPLTAAAAKVHDAMRLAIASARTLILGHEAELADAGEYNKITPQIWFAALSIYDRVAEADSSRLEGLEERLMALEKFAR